MKSVKNLDVNINMYMCTCRESRRGLFGEGKENTGEGRRKVVRGENEQRPIMYMYENSKNYYWLLTLKSC